MVADKLQLDHHCQLHASQAKRNSEKKVMVVVYYKSVFTTSRASCVIVIVIVRGQARSTFLIELLYCAFYLSRGYCRTLSERRVVV